MGPLSGKQHREYLKFQNKEAREQAKMELDEKRKQQLHEIKLQEAAAKANQGLGHKEQINNAKLKDMGIPAPRMNKQKLGIPTQNPLAGTGMFKQGQRSLPQSPIFQAKGTDTVPAMLTPGEAVIPRAAAQDPKNKKAIKRMVEEGRQANRLRDGAVDVRYSDAPGQAKYHAQGTQMVVPSLAYEHPDVPGSSFADGTEHVFSRGSADMQHYNNGTYGVVPQQVQSAVGYNDGTEDVSNVDRFLNWIAGQDPQPVKPPLAQPPKQDSDFNTVIEKVFQREYPSEDKAYHVVKGDKGGPTKYGISQRAYPNLDIKNLTKEQAIEIAKRDYWDKNKIDQLDPSLREIHFDTAFNKGSGAARKFLELSGGDPTKYLEERQKYVDKIVKNNPSQKKFQQGWSNRVNDLKKIAEAATDVLIPSAQAGTLPVPVPSMEKEVNNLSSRYPAPPEPTGRDVLIAKQDLATSTNPKVIQAAKDVLAKANQSIPTMADVKAPIFNMVPPDMMPVKDIRESDNLLSRYPDPQSISVPKPIDTAKNEQAIANDIEYNTSLGEGQQAEVPAVEGTGFFQKQNQDRFNMLGKESQQEADKVSQAVQNAIKSGGTKEEQQGFLANALAGIFGPKGLFSDKELVRFGLVAAGGLLTGGSVGGSLRAAGLSTLQASDRRHAEEVAAEKQKQQFLQQEEMFDKRLAKEREFRKEDLIRAEDKQLETEMIKEGRDAVAVRNWIRSGQKGEAPEIKTSYIRNGKSELMTVTTPTNIGGQVFKPGDPVWVYETVQQVGPRKGETIQMARIGDKSVPFDLLMSKGSFLDKWDSNKYGEVAKLKRAQDFSERLAKNHFEPIVESYFGASNIKGKANPERKGLVTAGSVASQVESYFRKKVDLDDRVTQTEIEKITAIAADQLVSDIESGTFKNVKDITPYLAAGEFRERGKLSDKLVTLDKKSGRMMSADDILALRDSASNFISKSKIATTPDAEIARLAEVWTANPNGIQNKYKNSDRNTAFALFALDTFKK
jgi:lysozyme family protein